MALKVYIQIKIEDHSQALDAFSDITDRVALEDASWSRDADGMSSQISFSVFTVLPYTAKHWSEYSGANDDAKLATAIADQGYRLQIPVRAEFYLEESTTSERVFGGVITAVDYGQESGYIVAQITGGDYTQLLDEWVVNRYAIPYASKDTDVILGNIVPNAYSGVATPSLFDYNNLARNIDGGTDAPDINPIYYAVSQIQKTGLGSYTSSVVSSIITTEDSTDFLAGERVIITGTVGPDDVQGTFDFDGTITSIISATAFVIASFPSTVSATAGTVYPQETAIARHDYIESASDILFSPVYNEYGEPRDIERISRKSGSERIYVENSAQAYATIETTPSAGYYYAVKKIQPITDIIAAERTALVGGATASGLTIAYIEPNTDKSGASARLDGAPSDILVSIDKVKHLSNGAIQIKIQAGKPIEAKVGTLCWIVGFAYTTRSKTASKRKFVNVTGRYTITGITADGVTGVINIEPVDETIRTSLISGAWKANSEYDVARAKANISAGDGTTVTVDGYVYPGVAIVKGDQWVITGEDRESKAVTGATAAASYVSTSSIRAVKVDTSEITYIVNGAVPFTSGDFIKVINATPTAFNFGDKDSSAIIPKKVYDINKAYAVSGVSAAPTTITANYITDAKVNADGSITFSYDDADPGFVAGNFVSISSASPSAYNADFARISAVVNQNKAIAAVIQASTTSASATSFDSASVVKVAVSKTASINTIRLGYDQNNAGFSVGDYVSVSGATTASINTGYARVAAIAQEDRAISGVVASAQFTATENKVYAVKTNGSLIKPTDTGMSISPYASAYKVFFWFAPGTVPGISAGDIVTVSGLTPAGWNRATPEVVLETGTGTYDGTVRPYITIPYQKIPKNSNGIPVYPTSYPETIVRVGSCKYTTASNHGFSAGETVKISGVSDVSFDTTGHVIRSVTANTFTLVRSISGTSSGGVARNPRNYVTIEIPAIINIKTVSAIDASGATVTKTPVVKFRTSVVNSFNVGDIVTTESISSSSADVFNLTDQTVVALETYAAASGYQRANNGAGNVFIISSSAQGTYISGGVSYVERIKNAITVTGVSANSATPALLTDRQGVITRLRTNTYTTSVAHPFKVGDYPKVTGTASHNINASSQEYPVKYITSTTFVIVNPVATTFVGTASSREYYDSFKVAKTVDQIGITSISSSNTGYAERVPTVTYTSSAHGIINGNRVTITGITPSDFNLTDKEVINASTNVFSVRDEELITSGSTYTSGGSLSIASGENNGSFEIFMSPGMNSAGEPYVVYINEQSVRDDNTPAQTKAASTRIKIEYANIVPHNISKISKRNDVVVGDSVKVYGTIKNGIITSISQVGSAVTVTTSSHNILVGDRVTIANAGTEYDGRWTVTYVDAPGVSPQTFKYTKPGGIGSPIRSSFPVTPTWSVEFESGADISTAVGITQAERNASGVVTITTSEVHGINVNQRVYISILSGTKYEEFSGYQIVASAPTTTTITYQTVNNSAVAINGVTGSIYIRDGYIVVDTPNESTIYAKWTGTQEIAQRSVRATVNTRIGLTDVIEIVGTNNNDVNGQYRVVETEAITFFGSNEPYGGYFEAVPTVSGGTSEVEVRQGQFRKKQELATGKFIVELNGRTLRSAMDEITKKTSGQYWVDPYKNIRYKKRKIQNIIQNPIFESSSGIASSSGWTIDSGFIIDRDGDTGPYSTGYTLFSRGTRRPWKKIQFEPLAARSSKSNVVSISEIEIIVSGARLAADTISDEYEDPDISSINDGDPASDWASTKINETIKPSVYIEYDSNKEIESYKLYTGNTDPSSDPVSWNVYGVNDSQYTLIDSKYQYPVTTARGSIIGTFDLAPQSTAKFTITEGISVSPGKKYWVSARVKAGNISAASLQVSFALDDSSAKGNEVNVSGITIANEWQKLYTIVTVPSGKYKMYVSGVVSADDAFAYFTDFIATEINGSYGFSDKPVVDYPIINSAIPIKEYEIPEYSREGSGVANTVYVYAAIIKADDISSDGVVSVADGDTDITNTIENGDIDYSEKVASISSLSVASNIATVTTTAAHGFFTNDYVTVFYDSFTTVNGTYKITRTSDTTFTFSVITGNATYAETDGKAKSSYSTRNWSATGASIAPSSDYEISGSHSILVTSASAANINVIYSEGSTITITPGDAYRFSLQNYIPVGQTPRAIDLFIYFYKDSSITQIAATASVSDVMQTSGSWKNISVSGVAPTTAAYAKLEIVIKATTNSEKHYFDAAEIVDTSYQQIYSYSFTDTKAVWNSNGKIIEATETNETVATEEEISIAAKAYFESNPTGIESINFGFVYNSEPPEVGTVVPFIWRNMQIADVYVIKSVTTKLIGTEVFYEVQLTGDSELLGRGILSGKRTAIAISTDRDAGSRTINPPVYPYIKNGEGGAIVINWLHSAGGDDVQYSIWARSVPVGATQYISSQYKLIASGITADPAQRTGDTIVWGGTGQSITDITINKAGSYQFRGYDPRYSYQFVIRASIRNGAVFSQACYIPEPGSPITQYITPQSTIILSPNTISSYGNIDEYAESITTQSDEGIGGSVSSIISTTEDGSSAVFSFDGRGISIYNAQEYTDGLGVSHEVGTRKILESSIDTGVTINADVINTGVLNANVVDVINLNASNITAGTIDAGQIEVINLNADNITSGTITAEQIVVGSGSNTAGISPSYLSGSAGYAFWAGTETPSSASPFSIQTDGSVIASNITIVGGSLDASIVNVTNLVAEQVIVGSGSQTAGISSNYLSGTAGYAFWAGSSTPSSASPFSVTTDGSVVATNANISGTISASAGNIGGFAINATSITAGSGISAVALSAAGDYAIYAGSSTASAAPFSVTPAGKVSASDITISGGSLSSAASNFIAFAENFAAGVIDSVAIGDAAITTAKISTAAITSAKIESLEATKLTNISGQPLLITAGGDEITLGPASGGTPASTTGDIGIIGSASSLLIANKNAFAQAAQKITIDPGIEPEGVNIDEFYGGASGSVYAQTTEQAPGAVAISYSTDWGQRYASSRLVSSYANRFAITSVSRSGTTVTLKGDGIYELIISGAIYATRAFTVDLSTNSPDVTTYSQINGPRTVASVNSTYPGSISYTVATSADIAETAATGFYDLQDNTASSVDTYAINWLDVEVATIARTSLGVVTLGGSGFDQILGPGDKFYVNITTPDATYSANEGWQTATSVTAGTVVYSSTGGLVSETAITGTISLRNVYSKSGFKIKSGFDTVTIEADSSQGSLNINTANSIDVIGINSRFGEYSTLDFINNDPTSGVLTDASFGYAQFIYSSGIVIGAKVATESGGVGYGTQGVGASITFEAYDDNVSVAQNPVYIYMKEDVPISGTAGLAVSGSLRIDRTSQATLSSENHGFQIGPSSGGNLRMDTNEINAVSNGAVADIYINHYGGDVHIGQAAATTAGDIILGTSATNVTGAIIFKDGTGGSIRAFSATSGNTSIAIKNSSGSAYAPLVADSFFPGGQGSSSLDHNGTQFIMNDSVSITGGITVSAGVTAQSSSIALTASGGGDITMTGADTTVPISGNGEIQSIPNTTTLTTNSARWVLVTGNTYALRRDSSTRRVKTNILEADNAVLAAAKNLRAVHYEALEKDEEGNIVPSGKHTLGLIAEEIAEAGLGCAVTYDGEGLPDGYDERVIIAALLHRVNDLEARLAEMESAD